MVEARRRGRWRRCIAALAGLHAGSVRRRLLAALLLPMGVVMVATSPWDFQLAVGPAHEAYDQVLITEAQALADQVRWFDGEPIFHLNAQAERVLRANAGDDEYFVVRDVDGYRLGGDGSLPVAQPVQNVAEFSDVSVRSASGVVQRLRMVAIGRGEGRQRVVVQVAETLHKRQAAERRILAAMVLPNLLVALVGAVLLYVATRLALRPLEQLAQQVAERSPDDLRAIELRQPPAELQPVLQALNRLFERVQEAARRQQRFHSNVAHQLRTPLTGLRTQIELAQMDGAFQHDTQRHERIITAIDRLTHLIDQLLTLARAEAGQQEATLRRVPVDLQALIEERASDLVDQAIERGIDLGFQLAPTPGLHGVPLLIGELVTNLVDNALRYCPRGSVVTVSCGEDAAHRPWLAVEDNGPGIAPEQRERVFHRFERGTASQAEGHGLGLAIVQEIAQMHGATVRALAAAEGPGARFEVRWG
jgi:two-component system sensor histidine kinase TctE